MQGTNPYSLDSTEDEEFKGVSSPPQSPGTGPVLNYAINERSRSSTFEQDKWSSGDDSNEDEEEEGASVDNSIQKYSSDKFKYQRKALFRKTFSLQWRQKWTNVCQLTSPIMGMLIVVLFKEIGFKVLQNYADRPVFIPFPQLFGLNMKSLASLSNGLLQISTCDQWYMYTFADSAKGEDREFFGYNYGAPMQNPNASSMLSGENIMTQTCHEVGKTVPYFKEYTP